VRKAQRQSGVRLKLRRGSSAQRKLNVTSGSSGESIGRNSPGPVQRVASPLPTPPERLLSSITTVVVVVRLVLLIVDDDCGCSCEWQRGEAGWRAGGASRHCRHSWRNEAAARSPSRHRTTSFGRRTTSTFVYTHVLLLLLIAGLFRHNMSCRKSMIVNNGDSVK
jgi:hypothetical protein